MKGEGWLLFFAIVGLVVAAFAGVVALGMCAATEMDQQQEVPR